MVLRFVFIAVKEVPNSPPASCLLPPAYCLPLTAYRLLPTAFRLPLTAFRLNPSHSARSVPKKESNRS